MKLGLRMKIYNKLQTPKIVLDLASKGRHLSKKEACKAQRNLIEVLVILKNQKKKVMIVSAWKNIKPWHDSQTIYGIKVEKEDRNKYFDRKWKSVLLKLKGRAGCSKVNIGKKSFWDSRCRELVSKDIGAWLKKNRQIPWMESCPPRMLMEHVKGNKFSVRLIK